MSLKDPNNPSNTSEFLRRYVDAGVISVEEYETAIKEHNAHKYTSHSLKITNKSPETITEMLKQYTEEGKISTEEYEKLIKKYGIVSGNNYAKKNTKSPKPLRKIVLIILCVVLLISLVVGAVIYHNNAIEKAYNRGYLAGEGIGYKKGYAKGQELYDEIKDEYRFFHNKAVIVTTTGAKYHRYNCYHIKNKRFYIYNTENAKAKGYTPCLDCY